MFLTEQRNWVDQWSFLGGMCFFSGAVGKVQLFRSPPERQGKEWDRHIQSQE